MKRSDRAQHALETLEANMSLAILAIDVSVFVWAMEQAADEAKPKSLRFIYFMAGFISCLSMILMWFSGYFIRRRFYRLESIENVQDEDLADIEKEREHLVRGQAEGSGLANYACLLAVIFSVLGVYISIIG